MTPTPAAQRIEWLDAARGLAIVLVVFGHVLRGLEAAGEAEGAAWVGAADLALYSFHMPLFFFLAGLNVRAALARGARGFTGDKLWTVAWPYLLWSVVQGSAAALAAGATNGERAWSDLLRIGWAPIGQFWFLYALAVLHGVAVLTGGRTRWLLTVGAAAFAASIGLAPHQGLWRGLLHGALFYGAGVAVGPGLKAWRWRSGQAAGGAALAAGVFAAGLLWLVGLAQGDARSPWLLPCALSGGAAVLLLGQVLKGPVLQGAAALGRASMTIYVLHILAASGLRIALEQAGVRMPLPADLVLGTTAGVLAPLACHVLLKRGDLLWPLGLARLPAFRACGRADGAGGRGRTDTPFGTGF